MRIKSGELKRLKKQRRKKEGKKHFWPQMSRFQSSIKFEPNRISAYGFRHLVRQGLRTPNNQVTLLGVTKKYLKFEAKNRVFHKRSLLDIYSHKRSATFPQNLEGGERGGDDRYRGRWIQITDHSISCKMSY